MSCESVRAELVAYLQDELSLPRRAEVQRHVDGCRECSAELDDFRSAQHAVGRLRVGAASSGFEQRVQERIAAKVAELRARGSVRFRTGRERSEEARRWRGLGAWWHSRRSGLGLFLLVALPVMAALSLAWFGLVRPYFDNLRQRQAFAQRLYQDLRADRAFQLRQQASAARRDLPVSAEGGIEAAGLPGGAALRLAPVREAGANGHPEVRCIWAFAPEQWRAWLAEESLRQGTPFHQSWKEVVDASVEVRLRDGRLPLGAELRQLLGTPAEVSVLAVGDDHWEIWARADLDAYLRSRPGAAH